MAGCRCQPALIKCSPHQYSIAGDDSVTEGVTDLVRGTLCPALKALFEHGLKKPSLLGGACHPWLFIEEVITMGPCAFSVSVLQGPWCSPQSSPGFLEEVEGARRAAACTHPSLSSYSPCLVHHRQQAGKSRETLILCTPAWCSVRHTGNTFCLCYLLCPAQQPVMAFLFLQVG